MRRHAICRLVGQVRDANEIVSRTITVLFFALRLSHVQRRQVFSIRQRTHRGFQAGDDLLPPTGPIGGGLDRSGRSDFVAIRSIAARRFCRVRLARWRLGGSPRR